MDLRDESDGAHAPSGNDGGVACARRDLAIHAARPLERTILAKSLQRCCRDANLRDDIVQEAWLRVVRHDEGAPQGEARRRWLKSVALNCWRDHLRRMQRQVRVEGGEEVLEAQEGHEPIPGDDGHELRWSHNGLSFTTSTGLRALRRAMRGLSQADRAVLVAHYELGWSGHAAPDERPTRWRVARARARLLQVLDAALACEHAAEELA
ncbi:MAG: RNA polymerase sigma factor [Planctomycetia bacterium]